MINNNKTHKVLVNQEISMLVSSSTVAGAKNVSSDGSYFELQLETPLEIPTNAKNVHLEVPEASVWNVVPNISAALGNNKIYIEIASGGQQTFTIPDGLYSLQDLEQTLQQLFLNAGIKPTGEPAIELSGNDATQKVNIILNYTDVELELKADSPLTVLGFNAQVIGPASIAGESFEGDTIAGFNNINYFLIHSDLTNTGIRFNNTYNQSIAKVPIDVEPGSQVISQPFHPSRLDVSNLAGSKRTNLRFWLTDDLNNRVNTNGEAWSARLRITYQIPDFI